MTKWHSLDQSVLAIFALDHLPESQKILPHQVSWLVKYCLKLENTDLQSYFIDLAKTRKCDWKQIRVNWFNFYFFQNDWAGFWKIFPTLDFTSSMDGDGVNKLNVDVACPDDASDWPTFDDVGRCKTKVRPYAASSCPISCVAVSSCVGEIFLKSDDNFWSVGTTLTWTTFSGNFGGSSSEGNVIFSTMVL